MIPANLNRQSGFALLIFVVMLMGVGGFALVGYSQGILKEVEVKKFQHNTRVLKEAKQALLQYAYNYPQFNSEGPGRLPCPAAGINGLTGPLTLALCQSVGRLPWAETELIFYDARDADGEQLWYAVSDNFYNLGGGPIINSDSVGSVTLFDQAENIIYDGGVAGIAAVIIAPGVELAGQDRVANPNDSDSYLDSFNGFDNSVFTNGGNNDVDGFILGPIFDQAQNFNVVNDQIIVITADEVIEMAEKATLQAYRATIDDYLLLTGDVYPWLYNYVGVADVPGLSSYFPADLNFATELGTNLGSIGRIPSIFGDYFTETTSKAIESNLGVAFSLTYPVTPTPVSYDQLTPAVSSGNFQFNNAAVHAVDITTSNRLENVKFVDIGDIVGNDGQLTGTATTAELFTHEIFFWDDEDWPTGIWTICGLTADDETDCNRDSSGDLDPGGSNDTDSWLLRVIVALNFDPSVNGGVVNFNANYANAPGVALPVPASGTQHAWITGTFAGPDVIVSSLPISVRYEIDRHYDSSFDIQETGTLNIANLTPGNLALGVRYYPELPSWAFSNKWHNSVMMAYAFNYRPDQTAPCSEGTNCIQVNNLAGNNDNKISILTIAGQHDWTDPGLNGLFDDVGTVFDAENADITDVDGTEYLFDRSATGGNDVVMIVSECTGC